MKKIICIVSLAVITCISVYGQNTPSVDSTILSNQSSGVGSNPLQLANRMRPYQKKQHDSTRTNGSISNSETGNSNGTPPDNKDSGYTTDPNKRAVSSTAKTGGIKKSVTRKKVSAGKSPSNSSNR